jgi:putative heme-binding domain-containing protein
MIEGGGRPSGYFTGATGVTVYRGDAWPEEYRGDVFVADCGSNLVHRKKLQVTPGHVRREGVRADDEAKSEFLASTDNWFRPVQFFNAPDGCLWVIDMYRETIEHPWSLPVGLKRQLDLDSGRDRGRLWRLRPESGPALRATQRLAGLKPEDYVRLLSHPNAWHRETAARLLHERGARTGISELRSLFRSSTNQVARLQALGVIHGLGALDETLLAAAVRDPVPEVRTHALRWVHQSERESGAMLQTILRDAAREETDEGARLELAFVLSKNATGGRVQPVADLVRRQIDLAQNAAVDGFLQGSPLLFLELVGPAGNQPLRPEFPGASEVLQRLTRTLADRGGEAALSALRDRLPRIADPLLAVRLSATALEATWGRSLLPALAPVIAQARAIVAKGYGEKGFADSVALLSQTPWDASRDALLPLLEAAQSETVQRVGVGAIGRSRQPEALAALTNAFPHLKPGARQRAVAVLITRPEGARAALEATHSGLLAARDWTVPQMASMRRHQDETIRVLSEREFGSVPANRQTVVDQFVPALSLHGDAARGGAIFEERCSSCHQFKGKGMTLGPDLASVVSNGPEKLLVSILDPNREVAPNFVAWTVETKDGESSTGILASDDAAGVLLRLAGGLEARVPRDRVARLKPEGRSLMPEGLESGLVPQQMADLIAHLLGSSAR